MARCYHVYLHDGAAQVIGASGIMCIAPDGRVLFLKRSPAAGDHAGTWCFPGGKIEDGEKPSDAARRETREEAGVDIRGPMRGIDTRGGFLTWQAPVRNAFVPTLNSEHTEARWAHPDEAPRPLHPGVAATLKMLRDKAA